MRKRPHDYDKLKIDPRKADPGSSPQWRHIGGLVSTIPREHSDHSQAPVTLPSIRKRRLRYRQNVRTLGQYARANTRVLVPETLMGCHDVAGAVVAVPDFASWCALSGSTSPRAENRRHAGLPAHAAGALTVRIGGGSRA